MPDDDSLSCSNHFLSSLPFLGAVYQITKREYLLRCVCLSVSVRPSVGMVQLGSQWRVFHEN
jgi:hypothetical protein